MKTINKWMSKTNITHLLLDGGTISASEGFLEAYVSDVLHGEKLCVVEQKTGMFRFFVDVDFVSDEHELDFVKVSSELFKIVDLGPCALARAKPRHIEGKGTKYGLHIIWPESRVNKKTANTIRSKILNEFGSEWEGILEPNRVFDSSVYAGSGLRILWSYKGQDDNSTPYIPWGIVNESGFVEFEDKQPSVKLLQLFSIRIENSKEEITEEVKEECSEIERFIQTHMNGQENARILKITPWKKSKTGDMCLISDSKYCENIQRCHISNHVCFCLTRKGVLSQRCNDDACKGFKSKKQYVIPSRLIPNERSLVDNNNRCILDYLPDGIKFNRHI
jgi:hypothetical protein